MMNEPPPTYFDVIIGPTTLFQVKDAVYQALNAVVQQYAKDLIQAAAVTQEKSAVRRLFELVGIDFLLPSNAPSTRHGIPGGQATAAAGVMAR